MLVTVLSVFPEHRPRQIGLFVAAAAYLTLNWKCLQIEDPRFV